MTDEYNPPYGGSNKGDRKTGIVWSYRLGDRQTFHGDLDTRHEAIGRATKLANHIDGGWEVWWHESMHTEKDTPTVCDYCGFEAWYLPLMHWYFTRDGAYCTEQCKARGERDE